MLHPGKVEQTQNGGTFACVDTSNTEVLGETKSSDENLVAATSYTIQTRPDQIMLSTAMLEIKNANNDFVKCRALLDSGSQVNFISQNLVKQLNLTVNKTNVPISGITEMQTNINSQVNSTIKSLHNNFTAKLSFLVLNQVTSNIPSRSFNGSCLNIPSNLKLADPHFDKSSRIDLLLGAAIFYELLCAGQVRLGKQKPILQKTVLGWVVSGPLYSNNQNENYNRASCHFVVQSLQDQVEKFWAIEEFPVMKHYSKEELECEKDFANNISRDETGRFCVKLPLRANVDSLGDSLEQAKKRIYSLERKFVKNPSLKTQYSQFIDEYQQLGHMSKIPDNEINTESKAFYLPHHAVLNESSTTTKLRVVFDASAKSSTGVSLNDILKVGPTLQDELFEILIRFREHEVVITADIAKMYRQFNVVPEQRDLQRIVWRGDSRLELEHFRLNTVTYGMASASFLATRCLQEIANNFKDKSPELSKIVTKCFYVDDLILSVSSVDEAVEVGKALKQCLGEYSLPLRKWCSNKSEVLAALMDEKDSTSRYDITNDDIKKTLGVFWSANHDTIEYTIKTKTLNPSSITKRSILSISSQIFDPLGLVGPVTITAKIILQKLWQLQLGWDEALPLDLTTLWLNFYTQLESLTCIKIPRQCILSKATYIEQHGFCDASESAYGACVYLRSVNTHGEILVKLVCAKSRVAPLKFTSLPRLELCGALLLARLVHKVLNTLDETVHKTFLWTDSTIVLCWLAHEPVSLNVYVANRVSEIQGLSKYEQWNHIISSSNPADLISRLMNPNQLQDSDLWWCGPTWLSQQPECWPKAQTQSIEIVPEKRSKKITLSTVVLDNDIFSLKNSLFLLLKQIGWCLRFYKNLKRKPGDREYSKLLTISEMNDALMLLIKLAQEQNFSIDIQYLKKTGHVPRNSKLKTLDPFYENGLILVGGRLNSSDESYNVRHPIILPQKHPLTRLIIADQHQRQLHAGGQAILAALRERFWVINGKREVRGVLSKCRTCFRVSPTTLNQKMGNLPRDRIVPQRPFYICGIDYAGPFNVKDGKLRNRSIVKGYMCLFICFVTKAVHIELVGDLTTVAFLNCLKRFVSRRGLCKRIYSDNATNFVGANNELRTLIETLTKIQVDNAVQTYCLNNKIEWQFIPARSPHQGGLWESAIKSAKYHVVRIVGNRNLTFEDLSTIFAQVEAVLNSRPLTPLSSDPNDLQALTPGHFLIGDALTALPQRNVADSPTNRLSQYHLLQQIVQHVWKRWSSEYLTTLQQRNKWQHPFPNLKIGTLVVLKEDNIQPLHWKLGRVIEVHPGQDGITRVASVKTVSGITKRAVQKLCVLPMEDNNTGNDNECLDTC